MQEMEVEQVKEIIQQHGYEYIEDLGNDGVANVFLCQSNINHHIFAIKKSIKQQIIDDEYKNLIALNHPHIIKLYDSFEDDLDVYLVMEYCSNGTILQKGKLSYKEFVRYSKQILEAVAFCHSKNIALRDINPENIIIDQYDQIKLTNFGFAKEFQHDEKSSEKCGSLMLLAPEMFQKEDVCPFKADIWALGITFFLMATGKYPFKSRSIEKIKQMIIKGEVDYSKYNIHHEIQSLLSKMLVKNKKNRFSADQLLKLPIYSSNKLPLLAIEKKYIKPECYTLRDDIQKTNNLARCHTYRGIIQYPILSRVKNRFPPIKTF